jgi:hypothetical protein
MSTKEEVVFKFDRFKHRYYDVEDYQGHDSGYQNPEIALSFARRASQIIEQLRGDKKVYLLAVDGSSSFLSTCVKLLHSEYTFVSGCKDVSELEKSRLKSIPSRDKDRSFFVFLDDYYAGGDSVCAVAHALADYEQELNLVVVMDWGGDIELHHAEMCPFFVLSQSLDVNKPVNKVHL